MTFIPDDISFAPDRHQTITANHFEQITGQTVKTASIQHLQLEELL